MLKDPKLLARIKELGAEPMPMSPAEFGKLVQSETDKWAKVVKATGLPQIHVRPSTRHWLCRMPAFSTRPPQRTISLSTNFLNSSGGGETCGMAPSSLNSFLHVVLAHHRANFDGELVDDVLRHARGRRDRMP